MLRRKPLSPCRWTSLSAIKCHDKANVRKAIVCSCSLLSENCHDSCVWTFAVSDDGNINNLITIFTLKVIISKAFRKLSLRCFTENVGTKQQTMKHRADFFHRVHSSFHFRFRLENASSRRDLLQLAFSSIHQPLLEILLAAQRAAFSFSTQFQTTTLLLFCHHSRGS